MWGKIVIEIVIDVLKDDSYRRKFTTLMLNADILTVLDEDKKITGCADNYA